ncbi:MAG: bifunctional demethylmenaquinone methyltransferase/2-methoxy-6-polyprenyl-1,4-benzoquinol methylase UbiE, partial [Leptospirales bacterium]|nr:bifunctional demethylmenaquinone methyltransferase/2-methoxy-6-polyprenyl-1,4-benzoquinol methylase UbiE [Leptospirales bacterium]
EYSEYKIENSNPSAKKRYIRLMFDSLAPTYDLLNKVLSCGIDNLWRKDLVGNISGNPSKKTLDVCCGTGDLSRQLARVRAELFSLDFSFNMLKKGIDKKWLSGVNISGDATKLPFKDAKFDFLTIAFGLRNIPDLDIFLSETLRVLKPDGRLLMLELTRPENRFTGFLYRFYLTKIIPFIGGIISGKREAYKYLAQSILTFLDRDALIERINVSGFKHVEYKRKTFGIATIYICKK